MDFTLTPGYARFSKEDVLLVVNHDDVKVWEIDMTTKYCEVWTASGGGEVDVFIDKGEATLDWDTKATEPTAVTFRLPEGEMFDWLTMVESTRYTTRIVFYRVER